MLQKNKQNQSFAAAYPNSQGVGRCLRPSFNVFIAIVLIICMLTVLPLGLTACLVAKPQQTQQDIADKIAKIEVDIQALQNEKASLQAKQAEVGQQTVLTTLAGETTVQPAVTPGQEGLQPTSPEQSAMADWQPQNTGAAIIFANPNAAGVNPAEPTPGSTNGEAANSASSKGTSPTADSAVGSNTEKSTEVVVHSIPTATAEQRYFDAEPAFANEAERESYVAYLNSLMGTGQINPFAFDEKTGEFKSQPSEPRETSPKESFVVADPAAEIYDAKRRDIVRHSTILCFTDVLQAAPNVVLFNADAKAQGELEQQLEANVFSQAIKGKQVKSFDSAILLRDGRKIEFSYGDFFATASSSLAAKTTAETTTTAASTAAKGTQSAVILSLNDEFYFVLEAKSPFIAWFRQWLQQSFALEQQWTILRNDRDNQGLLCNLTGVEGRTGVNLLWDNQSEKTWQTSILVAVEAFVQGQWVPLGQQCVQEESVLLQAGQQVKSKFNWQACYGELPRGLYRLSLAAKSDSGSFSYNALYFVLP